MQSQDTEITLGLGKLLGIFFLIAALCAVCLGLGYSLGKNAAKNSGVTVADTAEPANASPSVKPAGGTASKQPPAAGDNQDLTFYKAVEQKEPDAKLDTAPDSAPKTASLSDVQAAKNAPEPELSRAGGGYIVQVAAVSKQEDAQALADALRKKNYTVLIATNPPNDKLYHVQIGPFGVASDAEAMRTRLVNDGYNPILKK